MRHLGIAVAAFSLWTGAATAATVSEATGVNSTLGIAPTTQDFVQEAAVSDMFEIQSSKLAMTKLSGAEQAFANEMITDHTKTSDQLMTAAKAENITVPTAMDSSHQKMLDKLNSLNGDDFRKQYFSDQVSAHKDAVSLFERYAKGGDDAKLKAWSAEAQPTLQHHLDMAKQLYSNS